MNPNNTEHFQAESVNMISLFLVLFSVFISISAVYLSWSCNSAQGISDGAKIFYAIFAFLFGIWYILFYIIFRSGTCHPPPRRYY